MSREGVCIHGALRRQCETCDLADQLEKMTKERYAWMELAGATQAYWDTEVESRIRPTHGNIRAYQAAKSRWKTASSLAALNPPRGK